jgi:hypothetical protein
MVSFSEPVVTVTDALAWGRQAEMLDDEGTMLKVKVLLATFVWAAVAGLLAELSEFVKAAPFTEQALINTSAISPSAASELTFHQRVKNTVIGLLSFRFLSLQGTRVPFNFP